MKGDLALDTIVGWIILLVMAVVVIGIIFHYSDTAKNILVTDPEEQPEAESFEYEVISESQMKTLIQSCWAKTGENFNKDFICFIVKGDMSSIAPEYLEGEQEGYTVVMDEFDNTKTMATIEFEDIGNKVIVKT
ncbi:MAG: hypothetical protein KAU95_01510 [Candidatus Aenigmarchaeota archaeon]|nr:hypothetical protein [Candidatus Aenigmarchaeota archaeon]